MSLWRPMKMVPWKTLWLALGLAFVAPPLTGAVPAKPNLVFILADDLGYGDVQCLNPQGKIPTPHLDRLAASGMIFTDAHSSSAVCTPTRYGLLTGRYNWRSRLPRGVQGGMSPPLIEPERLTIGRFLQQQGYHTACIGKWHLGMDWPLQPGAAPFDDAIQKGEEGWRADFTKPITRAPTSFGFSTYFGIAGSLDMVPYVFIDNDRPTRVPTMDKSFPMLLGHTNQTRRGPAAADFEAVDVLPEFTRRAVSYIQGRAEEARNGRPFFLYLPLAAPHTATIPSPDWRGRSGLNAYADFVMQTDAAIGTVLETLDRSGLSTNTLVIVTSDNGCSPEARYKELLAKGHDPSAGFRGTKADIFEGGHRVPFLVQWPGRVRAGSRSGQLICLNDFFATCADILEQALPPNAGEDSVSFLPALEARASQPLRAALVHHSINGSFAIRQGPWKLALCPDSGGWSPPTPGSPQTTGLPQVQLYNLDHDRGETDNLAGAHPEIVQRLTALLEQDVAAGRSTPGPAQANSGAVVIRPAPNQPAQAAVRPPRPNILFLFADDMRADTIAAHGNAHIQTPNLDRLVAEGFSFRRNYVFGGNSGAVCVPSRAMLMSGKTWFRIDAPTLKGELLLPEVLANHGYATFGTGKWHNGPDSWLRAFQRGKSIMFGGMSDHTKVPLRDLGSDGELIPERQGQGFSSELFADAAIEFLQAHDRSRPFFAYVAFTAPHDPRQPPPEFRERYYRNPPPLPPNFLPQLPFDNGMMNGGRDENLGAWPRTEAMIRDQLAEYYGLITHLDEQIGRILAALRETGQAENTLILFAADNGLALGSHGLLGKQSVFEHSMHVPLILAGPGIPKGKSSSAFTYLHDLFPTLCEWLALPHPAGLEGHSLVPLWQGTKQRVRHSVFLPFLDIQRAVRDERWKLIAYPKIGHLQLFDLSSDPHETNNLIARPDLASEVDRLRNLMQEWQIQVGDTVPLPAEDRPPAPVDLTGQARKPDQWQPEWIVKKYFEAGDQPSAAP